MTEIDIPTYQDLMLPNLEALERLGGSGTNSEIDEAALEIAEVSDDQLDVLYPEGSAKARLSKVMDRLHWARTYLRKIGAIQNSRRAVWSLTSESKRFLTLPADEADQALRREDARIRREMYAARNAVKEASEDQGADEADVSGETSWQSQLLEHLMTMDPGAFERLAQRVLRDAGFRNVQVIGKSGDGGLDGVGVYKVSLVSFPTFFQCKRYKGNVGAPAVRDFRGAMAGRGDKGLLITTGTFSPAAREEATRDGAPPIDLVDGEELCELLKQFRIGVETTIRQVEDITLRLEFFDEI